MSHIDGGNLDLYASPPVRRHHSGTRLPIPQNRTMLLSLSFFLLPVAFAVVHYVLYWQNPSAQPKTALDALSLATGYGFGIIGSWVGIYTFQLRVNSRFYFLVARLRSMIYRYPDPSWTLVTRLECERSLDVLDEIESTLIGKVPYKGRTTVITLSDRRREFKIDGYFDLVVSADKLDDRITAVHLVVSNLRVTLTKSEGIIKDEFVPIINTISNAAAPVMAESYSLIVSYDRAPNPFIGYYLNHLPPRVDVSSFNVTLNLPRQGDAARAEISKEALQITATTRSVFQETAIEFLTLSPLLHRTLGASAS